ncbi:3-oxoacyl-[acyl-carrier-protein] reductase FabG-like isoform X2 [Tachypleus tridentatus]|uniref:3-oxoacyl-[acyl-carrier-protein] reductase FabG-like isoform X2 n=1 Tax=Tachypleus tridentatus TaxID=6853 RepID=UPI003FD5F7BA
MAAQGLSNLTGKVALITGASSGVGAATALLFSRLGASLSLTGRKKENLEKIAKQCEDISPSKHQVNNAGIIETGTIENTSLEQYDKMFNINVRSVYHLTMLAVPYLVSSKGNIVNVSSVNGLRSFAGVLTYCMSKSAVDQFTHCVALELAPKQVRVNAVNPGVLTTGLQLRGGLTEEAFKQFLERSKTTHALGRPGEAEEVAVAIAFLASDEASFITGVTLPVDGGRHTMCPR